MFFFYFYLCASIGVFYLNKSFGSLTISYTPLVAQTVKHLPTMRETRVQFLGQEDLLEKEMAAHSSILAWRIP